ncbi:MAG: GCN5-related N-acetyltransferase [Herbinix sp.]|jgi:GNAT superfamily N-acetyltransferase|nr:GCN5-related N-acetyltransferase [Herbinix sp.]
MIEIKEKDRNKIQHLFQSMEDSMILSCLQGHMGRAWTDNMEEPKVALIQMDCFCFIAGEDNSEVMMQLIAQILDLPKMRMAYIIAQNRKIGELVEVHYRDRCKKIQRYSIKKRMAEFDLNYLRAIVNSLPKEYTLHPIDDTWYQEAVKEDWSCDFVSNFRSKADYLERGIGRVIVHDGKIVSGASSYTVYDDGIEIEIDTREEYRRQGLATVAGAALILDCREKGLYPCWDAANMMSVHLAEKLGYEFKEAYDTFVIRTF